jgi:quercetin 2,3-dioxygenase
LKGSVYVNKTGGDAGPIKHEQYHTLVLSANSEPGVEIEAASDGTEVVLISGEPLDQEVVQYGPFGKCYTQIERLSC